MPREKSTHDIFAEDADAIASEVPDDSDLGRVRALAVEIVDRENIIIKLEEKLKDQKKLLRKVAETDLPDLMTELGLLTFTLVTGEEVSVEEKTRAHISKEKQVEAYKWLRANDSGSLIKTEIKLKFGMGKEKIAAELVKELTERGLQVGSKESVAWNALEKLVRERITAGELVDQQLLGVYETREAKVVAPKKNK